MGRPTRFERPTTTQWFPAGSCPVRRSISTTPLGVQGASTSPAPVARRPTLRGWKPSDVLGGVDGHQHARLVDLGGERELNQNAVNSRVCIELVHEREQLGFRSVGRQGDLAGVEAELAGIPIFHAHVDLARGIIANEHCRETRKGFPAQRVAARPRPSLHP